MTRLKEKAQYYKSIDEASKGKEEHRREECSSESNIKEQALPSRREQEQEQTRKQSCVQMRSTRPIDPDMANCRRKSGRNKK